MRLSSGSVLLLLLGSSTALAADPAVNVGVLEVAALPSPQHVGLYPYLALSFAFPGETVTLVPSLGVECAPELGAWGLVAGVTADFPITAQVGIDLIFTLVHDQPGLDWNRAAFYAGLGLGASLFLEQWVISPSVSAFRGLNVDGWTLAPGLNVALAF